MSTLARLRKVKLHVADSNKEVYNDGLTDAERRRRAYIRAECTVILMKYWNGETKEVFIPYFVTRYSDLQREIAKTAFRKSAIFVVRDNKGSRISQENFSPEHFFQVIEMSEGHTPTLYPLVRFNWEINEYLTDRVVQLRKLKTSFK